MRSRFVLLTTGLCVLLFLSALCGIALGATPLPLRELFAALFFPERHATTAVILYAIRIPRLLAAILGGIGLSVAGLILQNVMNNPLASPNTIGTNAGAGLATVLVLTLAPTEPSFLPLFGAVGAAATCLLILLLSRAAGGGRSAPILCGIGCTSLFQAAISLISALDTDVLAAYSSFAIGSFSGVSLRRLLLPSLLILLCLLATALLSGRIRTLALGDAYAASLGVRVGALRIGCILIASLSAAAVVSYAGLLGFVGLVVPNMARKLVGDHFQRQLPVSALLGSILLIWTDLAGRTLFSPSEVSVGVFCAMLGAPTFFLVLLKRKGAHRDPLE